MKSNAPLPMKVVGRKSQAKVDVVAIDSMQRMANVMRQGCPFIPKGVWRFKSFAEADEWTIKMLTRHPRRGSQL